MLEQEAEGIAMELRCTALTLQPALLREYCVMLSTADGNYEVPFGGVCADTYGEAETAIKEALARFDFPVS